MKTLDNAALTSIPEDKQIHRDDVSAVLNAIRQETKQGGLLAAACMLQKGLASRSA